MVKYTEHSVIFAIVKCAVQQCFHVSQLWNSPHWPIEHPLVPPRWRLAAPSHLRR